MVSTRHHPRAYPPPESPTGTVMATKSPKTPGRPASPTSPTSPSSAVATRRSNGALSGAWAHTPANITLIWLLIAVPLVTWDTGYVLLRPWTMPGGWLHKPIWGPYDLYGRVDLNYGVLSWQRKEGWTGAQGFVNGIETLLYLVYVAIVYAYAKPVGGARRRAAKEANAGLPAFISTFLEPRVVPGKEGAFAALLLFGTLVCTFAKTVLYMMIEVYGGFSNLKHNDFMALFWVFIIPNGAWLLFPSWCIYITSLEILQGLAIASGDKKRK